MCPVGAVSKTMQYLGDRADATRCVVLDGNRLFEDILCKAELDAFAQGNEHKAKLLYTLTQGPEDWTGLRGRIAAPLLKEHAERAGFCAGDAMVLICGPEALEKSAQAVREPMAAVKL